MAKMEVGCLRHKGASTIDRQLLHEDCSDPWLANPGNPAMSPHAGTGTHHTVETVERGRERGHYQNARKAPHICLPRYNPQAGGIQTHAHASTSLTTRETQELFVINSIKLHLS